MSIYFHPDFYTVYTNDPAAEAKRMEVIMDRITPHVDIVTPDPIAEVDLLAAHPVKHIERIRRLGLYEIAALAAGAAKQAAVAAMQSPSFALIRPPGHHASADRCWGGQQHGGFPDASLHHPPDKIGIHSGFRYALRGLNRQYPGTPAMGKNSQSRCPRPACLLIPGGPCPVCDHRRCDRHICRI